MAMLIEVKATQAEMDEMELTPDQLAAAVLDQLNLGIDMPDGGGRADLAGFDIVVKVTD